MAGQAPRPKQGSRWGSLLSGAVAGLESRLDTILAEDSTLAARQATAGQLTKPIPEKAGASGVNLAKALSDTSRSSSLERKLQERSTATSKLNRTHSSSSLASTAVEKDTNESSDASTVPTILAEAEQAVEPPRVPESKHFDPLIPDVEDSDDEASRHGNEYTLLADGRLDPSPRPSLDTTSPRISAELNERDVEAAETEPTETGPLLSVAEYQERIAQQEADREKTELQRQEEVHGYLERLDALQAKLQYLTKETADTARKEAAEAPTDSFEQKLAAKDEQIALLIEEGRKMSKAEVTQSTNVKKLRLRMQDDARAFENTKKKLAAAEQNGVELKMKIRRLEAFQRDATANLSRLPRLEKELINWKADQTEKQATIESLQLELKNLNSKAAEEERKAISQALDNEREISRNLRDDLGRARSEKQKSDESHRLELNSAKSELQHEKDRYQSTELSMRSEIQILESRLEAFRSRTEEASSANVSDGHANLLRQVETLQSQYALASENWHGIESSMQARMTTLEKERDDAARQESEVRKKARESTLNARRLQDQVDDLTQKAHTLEEEMSERRNQAEKLQARATALEKSLKEERDTFDSERQSWETSLSVRIEEERAKWNKESAQFAAGLERSQAISPLPFLRKPDLSSLAGRRNYSRAFSPELTVPSSSFQRPVSRRSTSKTTRALADMASPPEPLSVPSTPPMANGHVLDTPSLATEDQDYQLETGSSPHRTINDMISQFTAAAGPSVQLVERMSAAVRRLESEKAASKDELARISVQRDDTRKEVVSLMQEVEEKRSIEEKAKNLEQKLAERDQQYQRILEILGEKTERVDELEADVQDLKQMYRDLVETTVK